MEKEHVGYEFKNRELRTIGELVNYYSKLVIDDGRVSIKDIISNPPATIILWSDDTKTVVKCSENDVYDFEKGLAMCFAKKAISNNGNYYNLFKSAFKMYKEKYDKEPPIGTKKKEEKEADPRTLWIDIKGPHTPPYNKEVLLLYENEYGCIDVSVGFLEKTGEYFIQNRTFGSISEDTVKCWAYIPEIVYPTTATASDRVIACDGYRWHFNETPAESKDLLILREHKGNLETLVGRYCNTTRNYAIKYNNWINCKPIYWCPILKEPTDESQK